MRYLLQILTFLAVLSCSSNQDDLLKQAIELDSLERFQEAIVIYDKLLKLDSSNASVLIARAYDKERIGDEHGKIKDLTRAAEVGPDHALPMFELGIVYGDLGQYTESIAWFNKAITAKGGFDWVKNDFIDSKKYLLDVPIADIMLERGIVHYKADSVRKAYFDLTFCIEKNQNLKESYYYRAQTYLKSDMLKQACDDLKMAELHGEKNATEMRDKYCK